MKQLIAILNCLVFATSTAQEIKDKTIYLDSIRKETSEGRHESYRVVKDYFTKKDLYTIEEYFK